MKNIEKLYILWYTKTVNTMGKEGIYLADIINQADKLSEKQSEYMKLIAEIMEIRKRGEKPLAFVRTYGCQQNVADSE